MGFGFCQNCQYYDDDEVSWDDCQNCDVFSDAEKAVEATDYLGDVEK